MTRQSIAIPARWFLGTALIFAIPVLPVIAVMNLAGPAHAAEPATGSRAATGWSQWRGPNRDGVVTGFRVPDIWPKSLAEQWSIRVGDGYSSPVVAGGLVYQLSRQGDEEQVRCLRLETGETVWHVSYPASGSVHPAGAAHGIGPKSTPVVARAKLYTLGIGNIVSCFEARTGKLLWRKTFAGRFAKPAPSCGASTSPLVDGNLCIVHVGHDRDGAMLALDADTGQQRWEYNADGPGYGSPIIATLAGKRQIVMPVSKFVAGIDIENGNILWREPFPTFSTQNIITPLQHRGTIITGGIGQPTVALRPGEANEGANVERVWENKAASLHMSSPVLLGGRLFGLSRTKAGQLFCLDADTGKTLWQGDERFAKNAAILAVEDLLAVLTDHGKLIFAKPTDAGLEHLAEYSVDPSSRAWAHPLLLGNRILVKGDENLTCWSLPAPQPVRSEDRRDSSTSGEAEATNRFPLEVLEPPGRGALRDVPVSVGVVFPKGTLGGSQGGRAANQIRASARSTWPAPAGRSFLVKKTSSRTFAMQSGRVVDDRGRVMPLDTEVTAWWEPERRSVKWLLLKFPVTTDRRYWFEFPAELKVVAEKPIATRSEGVITVHTGPLDAEFRSSVPLFSRLVLNGRDMLSAEAGSHRLVLDGRQTAGRLSEMSWQIEEATPRRATIRGRGFLQTPLAKRSARLDLRIQFFKNESFVRLYHTLTWMIRDPAVGAREISLRIRPDLEPGGEIAVGVARQNGDTVWRGQRTPDCRLYFHQRDADSLVAQKDEQEIGRWERLSGWIRVTGSDGRGMSVSLRDAWQMYPKAFRYEEGKLAVEFWPSRSEPMGFSLKHVVPESLYRKKEWTRYAWSKESKHAVHEQQGKSVFEHTAEGVARTHELMLFFFDRDSKRSHDEIHSLTQQPVVVRQDPAAAMKVPVMGFSLSPVDRQRYPRIEEAVDTLGRLTLARWKDLHDYGFWRFGMVRWGSPPLNGGQSGIYRWMDGVQYDLQLIPWILFLRGGSRDFYLEGERVSRFAMDVCTNHFNTRGVAPGYQVGAAISPFPWNGHHLHKSLKIHFLQYYYHLTGYRRAKDVMKEVTSGAVWAAEHDPRKPDDPAYRSWAREQYNVGRFWVNAYEETFDPKCRDFARQWLDLTLNREYNATLGNFRSPGIYLSGELSQQSRLWPNDKKLKAVLLEYLDNMGIPRMPDGGVRFTNRVMLCDTAYRLTGDRRYAETAFDVARSLADLVPILDASKEIPPEIPFSGNGYFRWRLGPILVGLALGRQLGLHNDKPHLAHDTHIGFPAGDEPQVYFRASADGDLQMRVFLRETWNADFPPVKITVLGAASDPATILIPGKGRPAPVDRVQQLDRQWRSAAFAVKDVKAGKTYALKFEGGNSMVAALVLADAQVVHRLKLGQPAAIQNHAGQYHSGGRVFLRTNADTLAIQNTRGQPFSIRDAATWKRLYTSPLPVPKETEHQFGKDRLIAVVLASSRNWLRVRSGVHPWVAAGREAWFMPKQSPLGEIQPTR